MESKNKKTPCIAVFGTGSDVGKSVIATALCRYFTEKGYKTAPFKAQNMSNNSGITPEGLEMGRAQIVQAEASRKAPHVDMNPILLKPTSDVGSQVVLLGKVYDNSSALKYHAQKEMLFQEAGGAFDRLAKDNDMIIMEGAGSCAEVNLMPNDIVNFKMADYADADVILVADIHKGGVFAQIVGTLSCLPETYQNRIKGFIINRFRGDIRLFEDGVRWIEEKTNKPVFGVLPWYHHITIDAEDSVVIEKTENVRLVKNEKPVVGIIRLPHISNFTDFDPLDAVKEIDVVYVETRQSLSECQAVIIPGSKNTRADLTWLKETGWDKEIIRYAENGGFVLGICGGYQILGTSLSDPGGIEGNKGSTQGLGLLPVVTTMKEPKVTTVSYFEWHDVSGTGYEIHMGETERTGGRPFLKILTQNGNPVHCEDGCISENDKVMGTYVHGFFDTPGCISLWLKHIGIENATIAVDGGLKARDKEYDKLLNHFSIHVDMAAIGNLVNTCFTDE